jgi:hypothetical protein
MDGQDLTVLLDGGEPDPRPYFTASYHDHVWARDDRYVLFTNHAKTDAKLFDVTEDPEMRRNVAGARPEVVKHMFDGYILKDAGGSLPSY